jgi:multidrug efflux system outer membrane protein
MKSRALLLAALLLAGCSVGPDYKRPELIPNEFRGPTPDAPAGAESLGDIGWWQIFRTRLCSR